MIQIIEFAEIIGYLSTVYGTEVSKERVKVYFELLKDIDIRVLTQAVKNISAKEKYFPTPAGIRQESVILTTNKELTVDESIQLINKAINNYGFYKTVEAMEYIKEQDEKTYQIVKNIGFRNLGMTNMGVWLNCVKSMYTEIKEAKKNELLLPQKFQTDVNKIKMIALRNQDEEE